MMIGNARGCRRRKHDPERRINPTRSPNHRAAASAATEAAHFRGTEATGIAEAEPAGHGTAKPA
jgi:hypothetical protein